MRFMMLMIPKGYETAPPDVKLDAERVKAMMAYNEEMIRAVRHDSAALVAHLRADFHLKFLAVRRERDGVLRDFLDRVTGDIPARFDHFFVLGIRAVKKGESALGITHGADKGEGINPLSRTTRTSIANESRSKRIKNVSRPNDLKRIQRGVDIGLRRAEAHGEYRSGHK